MTVSAYENRKLVRVEILKFRTGQISESEIAVADVKLHLEDALTPDKIGPGVTVTVGLLPDELTSVRELERAALSTAHDILKRIADEPFDEIFAQYLVDRAS